MGKGEYWILDLVISWCESLDILIHPELEIVTNRYHHGLAIDELIETLYRLFHRGDLIAWIGEREFKPSRQEIKAGLEKESLIWFGLTPQGGERWEQYSNPHWDRYVDISYPIDPNQGEIIASSRKLVEQYLAFESIHSHLIISNSEEWDVLRPWQATYWKALPVGHRVRFSYEFIDIASYESSEYERVRRQREQYSELRKWYTSYLEED